MPLRWQERLLPDRRMAADLCDSERRGGREARTSLTRNAGLVEILSRWTGARRLVAGQRNV